MDALERLVTLPQLRPRKLLPRESLNDPPRSPNKRVTSPDPDNSENYREGAVGTIWQVVATVCSLIKPTYCRTLGLI